MSSSQGIYRKRASTIKMMKTDIDIRTGRLKTTQVHPVCHLIHKTVLNGSVSTLHTEHLEVKVRGICPMVAGKWWNQNFLSTTWRWLSHTLTKPLHLCKLPRISSSPLTTQWALLYLWPSSKAPALSVAFPDPKSPAPSMTQDSTDNPEPPQLWAHTVS